MRYKMLILSQKKEFLHIHNKSYSACTLFELFKPWILNYTQQCQQFKYQLLILLLKVGSGCLQFKSQQRGKLGGKESLQNWLYFGYQQWGRRRRGCLSKGQLPTPKPTIWGKNFYRQRGVLHVQTVQSALTVILKLVIGELTSIILSTVSLQFKGWFVSISEASFQNYGSSRHGYHLIIIMQLTSPLGYG